MKEVQSGQKLTEQRP